MSSPSRAASCHSLPMLSMETPETLKRAREALGLSRLEVYAATGVKPEALARFENGKGNLTRPQNILVQEFLLRRAALLANLEREAREDAARSRLQAGELASTNG
jgi:transcriptional regulator with XRE-family HTH domain